MHHQSTIIGRLTRNPELKIVNGGQSLTKLRVAASRSKRVMAADTETQWEHYDNLFIDVECWGRLATNVACSIHKGSPVICVGHLVTNEWESDGRTMSRIVLKAQYIGAEMNHYALRSADYTPSNTASTASTGNLSADAGGGAAQEEGTADVGVGQHDAPHEAGAEQHDAAVAQLVPAGASVAQAPF